MTLKNLFNNSLQSNGRHRMSHTITKSTEDLEIMITMFHISK